MFVATGLVVTSCSFSVSWNTCIQGTREGKCQLLCKFKLTFHIPNPIVFTQLIIYLICISFFQNQESLFEKKKHGIGTSPDYHNHFRTKITLVFYTYTIFYTIPQLTWCCWPPSSQFLRRAVLALTNHLAHTHCTVPLRFYHSLRGGCLVSTHLPSLCWFPHHCPSRLRLVLPVDSQWSLVSWHWCSLNSCMGMAVYALNGR